MANKAKTTKKGSWIRADLQIGSVNLNEKAAIAKNLSLMLKAGLTVTEALGVLVRTSESSSTRLALSRVLKATKSGESLSEAIARYPKVFSGFFVGSVYSGEASGRLAENLEIVSAELNKEKELFSRIKASLMYPVVVLIAALALGFMLSFYILPKIIPLFEGMHMKLPLATVFLISFAKFVKNYGVWLASGFIFLTIFSFWFLRLKSVKPFSHGLLIKAPLLGRMARRLNVARFCRILASMLGSGLNIVESLEIAKNTLDNWHYCSAIENVGRGVGKGAKLADCLGRYPMLFPEMVVKMVAVGEQSGKLQETLFYLADSYEAEVDEAAKDLSNSIEPILLLFIGLSVGFLALSIITPIYSLTGNINK